MAPRNSVHEGWALAHEEVTRGNIYWNVSYCTMGSNGPYIFPFSREDHSNVKALPTEL